MRANGRFSSLQKTSVVVIGAGFAGMTAARMLARAGVSVTLLERRPFPGGRAFSFKDQATGQVLDNGQHVLLGCCQETVNLLDDLGLDEAVYFQKSLDLPVFSDGHPEKKLKAARRFLEFNRHAGKDSVRCALENASLDR